MRPNKYISIDVVGRFWARRDDRNKGCDNHDVELHIGGWFERRISFGIDF
jgi:hypothetical protein